MGGAKWPPFILEDIEQLAYSGAVHWRSSDAQRLYEMFVMIKMGASLHDLLDGGPLLREHMLYLPKFAIKISNSPQNTSTPGGKSFKKVG